MARSTCTGITLRCSLQAQHGGEWHPGTRGGPPAYQQGGGGGVAAALGVRSGPPSPPQVSTRQVWSRLLETTHIAESGHPISSAVATVRLQRVVQPSTRERTGCCSGAQPGSSSVSCTCRVLPEGARQCQRGCSPKLRHHKVGQQLLLAMWAMPPRSLCQSCPPWQAGIHGAVQPLLQARALHSQLINV